MQRITLFFVLIGLAFVGLFFPKGVTHALAAHHAQTNTQPQRRFYRAKRTIR